MFFSSSLFSSSLLALLVPAEQELSNAEEVDHLRDAEQRRDHDHPTKSSLQKCTRSLVHQDLLKCVRDAFVRLFTRPLLKNLQPGLHHVEGVDGGGGDRPGSHAGDKRPPENCLRRVRAPPWPQLVQVGEERKVDDAEAHVAQGGGAETLVKPKDALLRKQFLCQRERRDLWKMGSGLAGSLELGSNPASILHLDL